MSYDYDDDRYADEIAEARYEAQRERAHSRLSLIAATAEPGRAADAYCSLPDYEDEDEEQEEAESIPVSKAVTTRRARFEGTSFEIRPGDRVLVRTWFTYKVSGPRLRYHRSYSRLEKGPAWATC